MGISRGPDLGRCWFYLGRAIVAFVETVVQDGLQLRGSLMESKSGNRERKRSAEVDACERGRATGEQEQMVCVVAVLERS